MMDLEQPSSVHLHSLEDAPLERLHIAPVHQQPRAVLSKLDPTASLRCLQVVQAEAIIEVNRWRVRKIEDEIRNAVPSPRPRAQHVGCAIGHRVAYFGGWGAETEKGSLLVLDIEQPEEKERR